MNGRVKTEGGKALSKNNVPGISELSEVEKTRNMINSLRHYPPEKQISLLENYNFNIFAETSVEASSLILQRIDELE